jgi:membrane-associated protein
MGFVDFIANLLRDPRAAIAGWIAAGPVTAYGFVFLIIFIETGVVFFPFLPGDSLLFASGFFAQGGGFNIFAASRRCVGLRPSWAISATS